MKNWTLITLMTDGMPVKVYINKTDDHAVIFPLFGKYFQLRSDKSVLDFATEFVVSKHGNVVTFESYLSSGEDTAVIAWDKIAS